MFDPAILDHFAYDPETGVFTWAVDYNGRVKGSIAGKKKKSYHSITWKNKHIAAHRLAFLFMTGAMPTLLVDHINGDRSDNRWANLREVTTAGNAQNRKMPLGQSGVTGVVFHKKSGKWQAQIGAEGRHFYLGLFDDVDSARAAYVSAKTRLHGEISFSNSWCVE